MAVLYTNNATSALSASITNVATSMSVTAGQGSRFPAANGTDWFYGTLTDNAGNIEIVKVTNRSTDTLTIVRGQDGTTARAWASGDKFELRIVKLMLDDFKTDARAGIVTESTGSFRTAVGHQAGTNGGVGATNFGYQAGQNGTGGNTNIGYLAGKAAGTNGGITTVGKQAGQNASGANNTLIGDSAGQQITTGSTNVAVGSGASGSTGSAIVGTVAIGSYAFYNGLGSYAVMVGDSAGYNSRASDNIGIGRMAMYGNFANTSTGDNNIAIGTQAMYTFTTAWSCVAVGTNALRNVTTGKWNTVIGFGAGTGITTGEQNTLIGRLAGATGTNNVSGTNNILIGESSQASAAGVNNEITLGNSSNNRFRIPGLGIDWTTSALPVLSNVLAINTISTTVAANDTTTAQIGWRTLTSQTLFGQSDGCMYTSTYNTGSMHQIFGDYRTGQTAVRGRTGGTWTSWRTLLDSSNYSTWADGPTFRAVRSTAQTVTANAWNKAQCNSEQFDTDSAYDNATNFRFQPTRAGYYLVTGNSAAAYSTITSIYKNGSEYQTAGWGSGGSHMTVTALVYLNGSTDYVEFYIWTDGTSFYQDQTAFSAVFVRA